MKTTLTAIDQKAINRIALVLHALAAEKGWHDFVTETDDEYLRRALLNLHGEISETWEAYRNCRLNMPCDKTPQMKALNLPILTCLEEEFADLFIRLLDSAARLKIDLGRAVCAKHLFNHTRSHRHGGKRA